MSIKMIEEYRSTSELLATMALDELSHVNGWVLSHKATDAMRQARVLDIVPTPGGFMVCYLGKECTPYVEPER